MLSDMRTLPIDKFRVGAVRYAFTEALVQGPVEVLFSQSCAELQYFRQRF